MRQHPDALIATADDHKFTLRLTDPLFESLESASRRESRSLNSEILLRLQRTFEQDAELEKQCMRTHLGLIDFLGGCVEELGLMLPAEQRADTKVQLMLELVRQISRPR